MPKSLLVLQGGAALGAYEVGVVRRLYEDEDFEPDVIAGVSMGAITAAILVASREDPLSALQQLWGHLSRAASPLLPAPWNRLTSLMGIPRFFRPRLDFWNAPFWSSFYEMSPLRHLLESLIDFDRLGRHGPRLLVGVTNLETGSVQTFDSDFDRITPDHLLASGALPPAFPATRIGARHYWDGGLVDIRPIGTVLERLGDAPEPVGRIIAAELRPASGWLPRNLLEVYDRIFELIFFERFGFDHRQTEKRNQLAQLYERIDAELPTDSPLRSLPGFRQLSQYRRIDQLDFIRNRDGRLLRGPFDFSPGTIERRIAAGYEDTHEFLRQRQREFVA